MEEDIVDIKVYDLDHSGLIVQLAKELDLVNIIDSMIGTHNNEIVSAGQIVLSLILVCIGFTDLALRNVHKFFIEKKIDLYLGKSKTKGIEIEATHLNAHRIGDVLDAIFEYGVEKFFFKIAEVAINKKGLETKSIHGDTTSHSFYGEYNSVDEEISNDTEKDNKENKNDKAKDVKITYGYSKDYRSNCKQIIQEMVVTSDGDIPIMLEMFSGNESDTNIFKERAEKIRKNFDNTEICEGFVVNDSKGYTEKTLKIYEKNENQQQQNWIIRVPDNIIEAKESMNNAIQNNDWSIIDNKKEKKDGLENFIYYKEYNIEKYNIKQKFIVIKTTASMNRTEKNLERTIKKEKEQVLFLQKKFSKKKFSCEADARNAYNEEIKIFKHHIFTEESLTIKEEIVIKGRKKVEERSYYCIMSEILEISDEDKNKIIEKKSCFVIGTNKLDANALDIIKIYKVDQQGVERGFRFLKNPIYFAEAFYLHKVGRIISLITIMTLTLMLYLILQRDIRKKLQKNNEDILDYGNKPTNKPTLTTINRLLQGIKIVEIILKKGKIIFIAGLTDLKMKIISLFGEEYVKFYSKKYISQFFHNSREDTS